MQTARLLLASSHPIQRIGLQSIVAAAVPAWQICGTASDGVEAVARAVAFRPDVVIMDGWLPRLNGLRAAEQIRRRAPAVEVLLLCDTTLPYILWKIFHSTVRGCLLKTESCDEILLALEAVRRRHRFRSCALTALCEENAHLFTKLGQLTPREIETIRGITRNLSSKEIARDLGVSESTIETHRVNCMRKLDLHSQIELFRYALRAGLVEL